MNANRVTIAATTTVTTMRSLTTRSAGSALVTFIIVVLCSIAREGEEMERNDGRTRRPRGGGRRRKVRIKASGGYEAGLRMRDASAARTRRARARRR